MIPIISAIIGGVIAGINTPVLSPVVYLISKYSTRLFLLSFAVYSIALGYEFELTSIYHFDPISVLAVIIPTLLLLDSGLKNSMKFGIQNGILSILLFSGLFLRELFILGLILSLINHFQSDLSTRAVIAVLFGMTLFISGVYVLRGYIDFIGGTATQVVVISSITLFSTLVFWRKVDTVDF